MEFDALTIAVLVLYSISIALIVATVVRGSVRARREREHARHIKRLRAPVEECIVKGTPMPRVPEGEQDALLELVLRYTSVIRGSDAGRLTEALEQQGVTARLLRQLGSRQAWRRAAAAEMLGRLRLSAAVPSLVACLDDPSEDVRTVAARSLAAIRDPAAVPALARALADPSRWTLSLVAENLMAMGSAAVAPLLELLGSNEHNVRVAAIQILGEIRDPAATPSLIGMLFGNGLNLRAQAAAALGKSGGPEAERALLGALKDPEWQVRAQAAKALGRLAHPGTSRRLAEAMPDDNWWVRVNCAESLARLGAEGRRQLELLTRHDDRFVRDQANAVLSVYGVRGTGRWTP
jgi:HEAT repeat protein